MKSLLNALGLVALIGLLGSPLMPARAQTDLVGHDTDLFTVNPNIPSGIPNVLIVLDNTSNWAAQNQNWPSSVDAYCSTNLPGAGNQQGDAEVCAIHKVVNEKVGQNINIGFMMYIGAPDKGGYVRFPMRKMDATYKPAFLSTLKVISTNNPIDKGPSSASPSIIMNDAFRYFNSLPTYTGIAAGSPGNEDPDPAVAHVDGYKTSSMTQFDFKVPIETSCGYDYIIFIGNGMPSKDAAAYATTDLSAAAALLNDTAVVPNTAAINNTGVNPDVWARFMYEYGRKVDNGVYRHITTYAIDVCKDQCSADWASVLKSMADKSQGDYYQAKTLEAIEFALTDILSKVQAVNSVFAATTLPVSINVRGTNLNQVYIGVFRPDAQLSPRWLGNLKHYKLGVTSTLINGVQTERLELQDANDVRAVNLNTGFIANTATSIWSETTTAGAGFWAFRGPNYAVNDAGKDQDAPDGDLVEKGGVAQKIRQFYPTPDPSPDTTPSQWRKIYTCTGSCASGSALKDYQFVADNADITATKLGTLVTADVNELTAIGQIVTARINSGHSFAVGDQVVITRAKPSLYNGTFTVLSKSSDTPSTSFTYSVSPATPDAQTAYVTLPAYVLNTATDKITVTGATPAGYDVSAATITAVPGSSGNQFSYAMPAAASTAAAGYTVTGLRRPTSIIWSSATNRATVTMPGHGYTGGNVTVSGASPADFNVPGTDSGAITKIDDNSFYYTVSTTPPGGTTTTGVATLNGHNFTTADSVVITGASGNFNTVSTGSSVGNVTANTFTYTTSGTVSGDATGTIVAKKRIATDYVTYVASSATIGTGSNKDKITLTIDAGSNLTAGQSPPTLVVGDKLAIKGVTCTETSGKTTTTRTCSTTTDATAPAGTAGTAPYTATITAVGTNTVTFAASGTVDTVTLSTARVYWTGATLSAGVTLTSVAAGGTTVTATGTIFVSQTGDLTTKVTSIASNAVASGDPDPIKAALSGSADPNERANLIDWVRGRDNIDNENLNNVATDVRASVHGDVLHSRPAVVNYNRNSDDDDVFVFYGTNDGLLRAVKGGSLAGGGGKEQWAFVAEDFFPKLKRLRDQAPKISSLSPRDYFFDGSIAVYTLDANKDGKLKHTDGDKVYLFITQRRGGRMLYALDVSDPLDPKLLWKKGCSKPSGTGIVGGCDSGFDEIGQTWSQPQVGYLRNWPDKLALIFGAGYDAAVEDFQACAVTDWNAVSVTAKTGIVMPVAMDTTSCPPSGGTTTVALRTMGRGIFILNALTGEILWSAGPAADSSTHKQVIGMNYAMPADIAAFRNRSNTGSRASSPGNESVAPGYFDRLYATDLGGNVWRVDVAALASPLGAKPDYIVSKLASIAVAPATGTHAALNYRKFPFSTDVVYSSDANGSYDAVLVGSGDREKPFDMVVKNRFYMFKDRNVTTMTASTTVPAAIVDTATSTDLFDATSNCLQIKTNCSTSGDDTTERAQLLARRGWKLDLTNAGEKTVATATTAAGTVLFNTFEPKEDTVTGQANNTGGNAGTNFCTGNLGTARQYGINYENATASDIFGSLPSNFVAGDNRFAYFAGGGFLPTPVPVVVKIDDKYFQSVIAGVQTTDPGGLKLQSRVRTYWYRMTD